MHNLIYDKYNKTIFIYENDYPNLGKRYEYFRKNITENDYNNFMKNVEKYGRNPLLEAGSFNWEKIYQPTEIDDWNYIVTDDEKNSLSYLCSNLKYKLNNSKNLILSQPLIHYKDKNYTCDELLFESMYYQYETSKEAKEKFKEMKTLWVEAKKYIRNLIQ